MVFYEPEIATSAVEAVQAVAAASKSKSSELKNKHFLINELTQNAGYLKLERKSIPKQNIFFF